MPGERRLIPVFLGLRIITDVSAGATLVVGGAWWVPVCNVFNQPKLLARRDWGEKNPRPLA
jgi:hypothetical protein